MSFSLLGTGTGYTSGFGTTTSALDSTGASLLIVVRVVPSGYGGSTLTDSKGNTWFSLVSTVDSFSTTMELLYSTPTTVGSSHTASGSGSQRFEDIVFTAWSGSTTSPPISTSSTASSGRSPTVSPGGVTPLYAGSLVIASVTGGSNAWSVDSGMTIFGSNFGNNRDDSAWIEQPASSISPTFTTSGNPFYQTLIAVFSPPTAAGILKPSLRCIQAVNRASTY